MQGLSSRAHAFLVEALVGKPCKRRKTSARPDVAGVNAEVSGDADTFTSETGSNGPLQFPSDQSKSAAGTPQGQKDSELGREGRKIRVGDETSCGEAQRSGQSGDPRVDLQGSELWNRFYEIGTEMIITKAGRYVYHSSQWMVAGNTDHSCISPRLYVHPDSPCAGRDMDASGSCSMTF
ncbi:T-box transcription factor TBX22-like [Gadus morhua]|uniref:T-box transcription factor TBX22-like n=1 Tax=Gadus morhua TaxID=8049 RepID=UPI0011B670F1|nr:T-box transcription factor TBX22-like [Gadus morhua]